MKQLTMDQIASADWKDVTGLLDALRTVLRDEYGLCPQLQDRGDWWVTVMPRQVSHSEFITVLRLECEDVESREAFTMSIEGNLGVWRHAVERAGARVTKSKKNEHWQARRAGSVIGFYNTGHEAGELTVSEK